MNETREEAVSRLLAFLGEKSAINKASIQEALFQAFDAGKKSAEAEVSR